MSVDIVAGLWGDKGEIIPLEDRAMLLVELDFKRLRGADHDVAEYIRTVKYEFAKKFQDMLYKFYRENPDAVVGGIEIPEPKAAN